MKKNLIVLFISFSIFAADPELLQWSVDTSAFQMISKSQKFDTIRDGSNQIVSIDTTTTLTWYGTVTYSCRDSDGDSLGVFIDIAIGNDTIPVDSIWDVKTAVTGNDQKVSFRFYLVSHKWTGIAAAKVRLSLDDMLHGYNRKPVIIAQPQSAAVTEGQGVTFSVTAIGEPVPSTYQWKKDGTIIDGATSASYSISRVQKTDAGSYTVAVTNSIGYMTSSAAVLTVNYAPSISTHPASQTVSVNSSVTFAVVAAGNPAPTYQWKIGGANIDGAIAASYTISNVQTADAGSYTVVVTNSVDHVTSSAAVLTVNYGPSITIQPVSQTVNVGSPVTFTVVATGNPAPTYQWKKGGATIDGAIATSYTISNVQIADAGSYAVVVSNSVDNVTSSAAVLTVNYGPSITTQPVSQTVNVGSPVTFTVVATGNPAPTYQWKKGGANIDGAIAASYTISNVQIADAGSYVVVVSNSVDHVTSSVAVLTVNYGPSITTQPISKSVRIGRSASFTVAASGNPAPTYQWKKSGMDIPGVTGAAYTIPSAWVVDTGAYTVVVMNSIDTVTSNTVTFALDTTSWFRTDSLVTIEGGTFSMGSNKESGLPQYPAHVVTVSTFKISNTLVTQGAYANTMGINPSVFTGDLHLPVEYVTWFDAVLYCNAKSKSEAKDTVYTYSYRSFASGNGCDSLGNLAVDTSKNGYRLPTEAEYEFACRAGTTEDYYWGGTYTYRGIDTGAIDSNVIWRHNSNDHTWPVGSKRASPWGLYDIVGQVQHWINDWYGSYGSSSETDPIGPTVGTARIVRGGSYSLTSGGEDLQTFHRENGGYAAHDRSMSIGFRVVVRE
jgi:formylglycine-generating enzyme required for sulfatase activity